MMSERKTNRNCSPENERKSNQMPTTSAHASTRITIEQKVSSAKKNQVIKCSVDPKDVVIKRRFGEGSKPLFSRDDIRINENRNSSTTPTRSGRRESSSSDSSEEHNKPTINTHREKSHSPKTRKTPDKIPYFIDAKREEDRLRAKYGHSHGSHRTRSRSPPRRRSRTRSRSPRRNRPRHRRRSRPRYRSRSRSRSRRRHRSYDRRRRSLSNNRYRDRSFSRDRPRRRSPYPEQRYIPVAIPMEYPYTAGWIPPPMPGYPQNPYMLRPPMPFYPLRPPFAPMGFPIRPPRFPGRPPRLYRPGPPKQT